MLGTKQSLKANEGKWGGWFALGRLGLPRLRRFGGRLGAYDFMTLAVGDLISRYSCR